MAYAPAAVEIPRNVLARERHSHLCVLHGLVQDLIGSTTFGLKQPLELDAQAEVLLALMRHLAGLGSGQSLISSLLEACAFERLMSCPYKGDTPNCERDECSICPRPRYVERQVNWRLLDTRKWPLVD